MKCQLALPACLVLLWGQTAFISCQESDIKVTAVTGGFEVTCKNGEKIMKNGESDVEPLLEYKDENSGEYQCQPDGPKIFVKFRTCDNCIELDWAAILGLAFGDVVATIVIGVAVYLIASQARIGPTTSERKSSDRQQLVPNVKRNRVPNDDYQELMRRNDQREAYDVLSNRR
ncbi:T-cell surface glycoprotein CD3 gamma chain isoform 1-T1 [Aulostomus maculatus]